MRTAVVVGSGQLFGWGSAMNHQLGLKSDTTQMRPQQITGFDSPVTTMATALYHSVAITGMMQHMLLAIDNR
jgi:alpha-tubulin suppressor-like RCC1 family protein